MGGTFVSTSRHDVVVIGFGPVGAATAGLLAARGLDVVAVDRDTDVFPLPRAAHMDQEALRVLQELGVLDDVGADLRPLPGMDFLTADRQVLLSMRSGGRTPSGHAASSLFHQPAVDRAIRHHAARLGADVRLGREVTTLELATDHVVVRLADGEAWETSWVVACDGARSMARRAIGTGMHDLRFEEPWLVLDLVLADGVRPPAEVCLQVCDPARPHTLVPMPPPRFRFEFMLVDGDDPATVQQPETVRSLLSTWIDPDTVTVERSAVYTFHGLVAERWREGRVLLAGDAAHQMPPFLGQGMCSGLRDAANLAWKLARVVHGTAPEALLETYQAEREPHVRSIVDAAVGVGRLICTTDAAAAAERDAAMLAARAAAVAAAATSGDGAAPANDAAPMPPLTAGPLVLAGGGQQARQVRLGDRWSDDETGDRFTVVLRTPPFPGDASPGDASPGDGSPADSPLADSATGALEAWQRLDALVVDAVGQPAWAELLDACRADVAVVRPDRYLLAAGPSCPPPPDLLSPDRG